MLVVPWDSDIVTAWVVVSELMDRVARRQRPRLEGDSDDGWLLGDAEPDDNLLVSGIGELVHTNAGDVRMRSGWATG